MKQWIKLTDKQLQTELTEACNYYQIAPNSWLACEPLGRVLYWMKDPTAADYFKKAIGCHPSKQLLPSLRYLALGNYCRMANEPELGRTYLLKAYDVMQQEKISVIDPDALAFGAVRDLVTICFLLGNHEEALQYGAILREEDPDFEPHHLYEQVVLLAEAKLNHDLSKAEQAAEAISWIIYSERVKVSSDGPFTPWDAYDLALQTIAELQEATK
jgi:tetratricopeptide (TPR) repeat protein